MRPAFSRSNFSKMTPSARFPVSMPQSAVASGAISTAQTQAGADTALHTLFRSWREDDGPIPGVPEEPSTRALDPVSTLYLSWVNEEVLDRNTVCPLAVIDELAAAEPFLSDAWGGVLPLARADVPALMPSAHALVIRADLESQLGGARKRCLQDHSVLAQELPRKTRGRTDVSDSRQQAVGK